MKSAILVITGERAWTRRALHLSAAMARETGSAVVIMRMVRVAHLEYLGAGAQETLLSYDEYDALSEYAATADAYGVDATLELFEYTDYDGGVRSAADQLGALAVFAPAPTSMVGALAQLRLWMLRRTLRRPLYTLGPGDAPLAWTEPPVDMYPAVGAAQSVRIENL